jgi:membrane fusion protein, multidrug efflux system
MSTKVISCVCVCLLLFLSSCAKKAKNIQEVAKVKPILLSSADIQTAKLSPVVSSFEATGELKPSLEAAISSEVEGQVLQVLAETGDQVSAGQLIAVLDSKVLRDQLTASQENLQKVQARAQLSQITLGRKKQAYAEDLIAKQDLDTAATDHQVALREVASAKTQLSTSQTSLQKAKVKSPINGIISNKLVKTGELAQPGKTLFEIVKINPLKVELALPGKYLSAIKIGQQIELSVSSVPGQVFMAKVTKVSPVADQATRSVLVTAEVPNPGEKLKANLFVSCQVKLAEGHQGIIVPKEALNGSPEEGWAVYIYDAQAANVKRRQVKAQTSSKESILYEVTDGLLPGEKLVTVSLNTEAQEAPVQLLEAN